MTLVVYTLINIWVYIFADMVYKYAASQRNIPHGAINEWSILKSEPRGGQMPLYFDKLSPIVLRVLWLWQSSIFSYPKQMTELLILLTKFLANETTHLQSKSKAVVLFFVCLSIEFAKASNSIPLQLIQWFYASTTVSLFIARYWKNQSYVKTHFISFK